MAELKPEKIDLKEINGGQEYKNGDGVDASAINGALKASAFAQAIATNQPKSTETGDDTVTTVRIINAETNPQFEFVNIKGEKGDKGDSADDDFVKAIDNKVNVVDKKTNAILGVLGEENFIRAESVENTSAVRETADATANGFELIDDFPTNVKSLKGNTTQSKNLVKYPFSINGTYGYTCLERDGYVTWYGKVPSDTVYLSIFEDTSLLSAVLLSKIDFVVGRKYILKNYGNSECCVCYRTTGTKFKRFSQNVEFEWLSNYTDGYIGFIVPIASGYTINVADRKTAMPMLIEVSSNPPEKFFNYTQGLEHAKIKGIKSTGKNLINYLDLFNGKGLNNMNYWINNDNSVSTKATGYNNPSLLDPIKLSAGTYTLSYSVRLDEDIPISNNTWASLYFRKYSNKKTEANAYSNIIEANAVSVSGCQTEYNKYVNHSQTFTLNTDGYYSFGIFATGGNNYPNGIQTTIKNIQLEFGETATEYEPYKESVIEFPKELELGKWDYIDFENGEIVKATKTITLTGNETVKMYTVGGAENVFYYEFTDKKYLDTNPQYGKGNCIVSSPYNLMVDHWGADNNNVLGVYAGNYTVPNIYIRPVQKYNSVEEFKAYIKNLYDSGNPIQISYELANPTREKIIFNNSYFVWNKGFEKIESSYDERGLTSFDYGANTIEENDYFGKV